MKKKEKVHDIGRIFAEGTLIDEALAEGAWDALRKHKQAGMPIVVWRNGKTVWIPAAKIKIGAVRKRRKTKPNEPS